MGLSVTLEGVVVLAEERGKVEEDLRTDPKLSADSKI